MNSLKYNLYPLLLSLIALPYLALSDFKLEKRGELYSLRAEEAVIDDILDDIDRREVVALRFLGEYPQTYSGALTNQTLDELLYRLGVSYLLTYEPDQAGDYRLSDAMMLGSGGTAFRSNYGDDDMNFVQLINDLRDDDIPWNGHRAFRVLSEAGCAAIPWLEPVLYDSDLQARYSAAQLLRSICPEYVPSQKVLDVTLELIGHASWEEESLAEFIWVWEAYQYLKRPDVYPRVRSRLLTNLQSTDRRERIYAALVVAGKGEDAYAGHLVRILAPHLADNDLTGDAGMASRALFKLGPAALPHLHAYRFSGDQQQSELAELICTALETGDIPAFNPVMYADYITNPLKETNDDIKYIYRWRQENFPDDQGRYANLDQPRWTVQDYYGPFDASNWQTTDFEETYPSFDVTDTGEEAPFPYTVKEGDTLQSICEKFSTTPQKVLAVNPTLPPNPMLQPGDRILIPWE